MKEDSGHEISRHRLLLSAPDCLEQIPLVNTEVGGASSSLAKLLSQMGGLLPMSHLSFKFSYHPLPPSIPLFSRWFTTCQSTPFERVENSRRISRGLHAPAGRIHRVEPLGRGAIDVTRWLRVGPGLLARGGDFTNGANSSWGGEPRRITGNCISKGPSNKKLKKENAPEEEK